MLLCCCKTCKTTKTTEQKLASFQICLHRLLNIKWNKFINNEEVLKRANAEPIKLTKLKSRWRYIGHGLRMLPTRTPMVMHERPLTNERERHKPENKETEPTKNGVGCSLPCVSSGIRSKLHTFYKATHQSVNGSVSTSSWKRKLVGAMAYQLEGQTLN